MRARRIAAAIAIALSTLVFLPGPAGAGGGCHRNFELGQTESTGTTVEMGKNCFAPTVVRVAPGAEVTWVNRDPIAHRVDGIGWSVQDDVAPGATVTQRFETAGTYPYVCVLHPGMFGAVVVGDGTGSGPVVNVATPTSLAATRAAAAGPGDNESGDGDNWVGTTVALGTLLLVAGFAGGRASRRGGAAPS